MATPETETTSGLSSSFLNHHHPSLHFFTFPSLCLHLTPWEFQSLIYSWDFHGFRMQGRCHLSDCDVPSKKTLFHFNVRDTKSAGLWREKVLTRYFDYEFPQVCFPLNQNWKNGSDPVRSFCPIYSSIHRLCLQKVTWCFREANIHGDKSFLLL